MHGQHDGCMAALVHLAFQIYEALVRRLLPALIINHDQALSPFLWGQGICYMAISVLAKLSIDYHLCYLKRPRYAELKAVMEQIPEIQKESLEQFDSKLLNPTLQKVADKRRKENFKRLIAGCIGVSLVIEQQSPSYLQERFSFYSIGISFINY